MRATRLILAMILLALLLTGCPRGERGGRQGGYDKERHVTAIMEVGVVALNTGNYAKALSSLGEAEKLDPRNPMIKQQLGRTYYRMREFDKAKENYDAALALDPALTDAHNDLGLLYLDTKEYPKAREQFQICLADLTYANSPLARFNLALVEEFEGNTEAAKEIHQRLISAGEQSASPYYRLAFLFYKEGDYTHAADLLDAAVRMEPTYAEAYFLLGETYEKLGQEEDAAEAYGQAVSLDPQSLRGIEAQRRIRQIMKDYRP
jgi:Tfp pilus assembly protein PilF